MESGFDLALFHGEVKASPKERNALRQDLVRGLKDYYIHVFGYDRYGAETVLLLRDRLGMPYIYGFAAVRIINDRRISDATRTRAGLRAIDTIAYGADHGLPYGLHAILHFLAQQNALSVDDLRYALLASAGDRNPFGGMDTANIVAFVQWLMRHPSLTAAERLLWGHFLITRHSDRAGTPELISLLMETEDIPREARREVCSAWIHCRQPRLSIDIPPAGGCARTQFIASHMPFWVAHIPSWPGKTMVRLGLVWLARLGSDPLTLAQQYLTYRDSFAEQFHFAVADIVGEFHASMPAAQVRNLVEAGVTISSSSPTRRKFYRLGTDLFGPEYLQRATGDTANSVRQWATRQLRQQD